MRSLFPLRLLPVFAAAADRPDILVADFEGDTYGDWVVTEHGCEYRTRVIPVASDPHLPWRLVAV